MLKMGFNLGMGSNQKASSNATSDDHMDIEMEEK
jgi:hypothetical protein